MALTEIRKSTLISELPEEDKLEAECIACGRKKRTPVKKLPPRFRHRSIAYLESKITCRECRAPMIIITDEG
ncbi:hypothetical protein B7H23_12930 [Notoacmeibacter marinus]|uniref:Uncharacterized protein n=1 Tax=Notoacmeibacter marinus TaxID=1876515 RepID=A0A231UT91_9HYPH|nr:hypothetical protein [Notoacmeibacter marinus]OXS99103.1 hypothetical protein B7H23_12930 [Notoacmeibacter marinus]